MPLPLFLSFDVEKCTSYILFSFKGIDPQQDS